MTPAQWNRVSDVFASAIELDVAERARLLDTEEQSVRLEVERLLQAHQHSGLLDRPLVPDSQRDSQQDAWNGRILNGRYRIERFLARGGVGAVYLAHDEKVADRTVVVKFLEHRDPWLKAKFREEMEALARIDHYGVVGILDAGETADGLPFLVIEFIDGVTLRSEILKGPIEPARAARLIRQIGGAVSAAHEKGVLHRDLKPENIMLERAGTSAEVARLIDFGIARIDRPDSETLTQTTRFAGTTPYMAPEQLTGRPSAASDIYAIGVLAYEMLSGRRPFIAASPVELYEQQRGGVKADLRRLRPEIPTIAARMVLKQLSFKPENRSASAVEAGAQIAAALEGQLREPWSRRRMTVALTSGIGLATAGAYVSTRSPRPLGPSERVIELPMGTEPSEHGFIRDHDIDYRVQFNKDGSALDSMRIFTNDQGYYRHPFTDAQAREAYLKGWKLTFEGAVEEGHILAIIDNPRAPARVDAILINNPGRADTAACLVQSSPKQEGIFRDLPGPAGARHEFVLTWTPATQGELSVDGVKLITSYPGDVHFRYGYGLVFGATRNRSQRGAGVFWKVRLEIG
jgi:hypothetical protein